MPLKALQEWYRVLKVGGRLIIAVPNADLKSEWIMFHLKTEYDRGNTDLEKHHIDFTPASLLSLIQEAGIWSSIRTGNANEYWELPGKSDWQLVMEAIK